MCILGGCIEFTNHNKMILRSPVLEFGMEPIFKTQCVDIRPLSLPTFKSEQSGGSWMGSSPNPCTVLYRNPCRNKRDLSFALYYIQGNFERSILSRWVKEPSHYHLKYCSLSLQGKQSQAKASPFAMFLPSSSMAIPPNEDPSSRVSLAP